MDNLTPPTPPEARRIAPDCQPVFPCWLYDNQWTYFIRGFNNSWLKQFIYWHPDQPTAPTQPPAPLAGGTASLNWAGKKALRTAFVRTIEPLLARLVEAPASITFGHGKNSRSHLRWMCEHLLKNLDVFPVDKTGRWIGFIQGVMAANAFLDVDAERDRTRLFFKEAYALLANPSTAPAEPAAGCKEGRPVSPASIALVRYKELRAECSKRILSTDEVDEMMETCIASASLRKQPVSTVSLPSLGRVAKTELLNACYEALDALSQKIWALPENAYDAKTAVNAAYERLERALGGDDNASGQISTGHDTPALPSDPAARAAVSPDSGEREAELRAAIDAARQALKQARQKYQDGFDCVPFCEAAGAMDVLLAALTPLLDRREGELAALHQMLNDNEAEADRELAALRTLVAKKDEALKEIQRQALADSPEERRLIVTSTDALALTPATITDELAAKDVLIADLKAKICDMGTVQVELRTDLATAQSALSDWKQWLRLVLAVNAPTDISDDDLRKNIVAAWDKQTLALRESEAARGEDSKRLDWLLDHISIDIIPCQLRTGEFIELSRRTGFGDYRAAIDAARAQEAKP